MFSHIVIGADDIAAAKIFYDAVLGALGHAPATEMHGADRLVYSDGQGILMVTRPYNGESATFGNGVTIGFNAVGPEAVEQFHAAGLAAGGSDEGKPGPRDAIPGAYAAYLRDPTGNKVLAWCVKAS